MTDKGDAIKSRGPASTSPEELLEKTRRGETTVVRVSPARHVEHTLLKATADRLLNVVASESTEHDGDDLAAVTLVYAASLECFLNDMFIEFARDSFGPGAKSVAEGLMGGSMKSKLSRVIPITSRGTKQLDMGAATVGQLLGLAKARNRVAHTVEHYFDESPQFDPFEGPRERFVESLTVEQCRRYSSALEEFFEAIWLGWLASPPWSSSLLTDAEPTDGHWKRWNESLLSELAEHNRELREDTLDIGDGVSLIGARVTAVREKPTPSEPENSQPEPEA